MNKIVKKVLGIGLSVALVGGVFTACTGGNDSGDTKTEAKTWKVGICQFVQHEALDAATNGFKDELQKLAEADGNKVEFEEQNAAGDTATCATITNGFVADNVDLIMANATPALQAAAQSTTTIPIVATSVTDFASALEIDADKWTGKSGINVTGTADLAPLSEQAAMFKTLVPDAKTVGIVYCSAEANSVYQAKEIAKELKKLGFETKEFTAADTNDIASVTQNACDNSDAIYIPTDNTMASATGTIKPIVTEAKKVAICGEEGICKGCGVATLSISYESIGRNAGKMAYEILKDGKNPAEMDIMIPTKDDVIFKYVASRAKDLGVTIPDGYEELALDEAK